MGYLVEVEMAGTYYSMGGQFPDVESAFLFINRYDPDGTIRTRIIDAATGRQVDFAQYLWEFDRVARLTAPPPPRKQKERPPITRTDWLVQGF